MIKYISWSRPGRMELLILCLTVIIAFCFFTVSYDDYGSFSVNMISGQYSDFPFFDQFWLGLLGVNIFYKFLQAHIPGLNWMGIIFFILTSFTCYFLLRLVRDVLTLGGFGLRTIFLVESLFAALYLENFLMLSQTRFSLLMCGLSLFYLAFQSPLGLRDIVCFSAVFLLGLLHRPESALGMLAVVSLGYWAGSIDIVSYVRRFLLPIVITSVVLGLISIDWHRSTDFVKRVEPEIEYKLMARQYVDLSAMTSAADSVKYEAATTGMWFDLKTMTPEYLRSLLLSGYDLSYAHAQAVLGHVMSFYLFFSNITSGLLCLLFFILLYADKKWQAAQLVIFQVGVFILLVYLDYNGFLLDHRHFLNIELIALLVSLRFFATSGIGIQTGRLRWKATAVLASMICISFSLKAMVRIKATNTNATADVACMEATMAEVEQKYQHKTIILTMGNGNLTNHNFSIFSQIYRQNRYVLYDMFTYSTNPVYLDYQSNLCHCDATDPVEVYQWMCREGALYIGDSARYALTSRYMLTVRGLDLQFMSGTAFIRPNCLRSAEYGQMELRKIALPTHERTLNQ